ncbi:MAG: ABC transporter permease [Hyphomicrobiales bacterium]|jgi:putative spermidine/putrescine transport system permease protein|nr:ABC transporter permease [Hyphomicrobiales bacterium]
MAHIVLVALAGLTYLLVLGPIVIVLITAFSPTDFFVFPPPGLSLRWFAAFFNTDSLRDAFLRSIQIALTSALLATLLGSMAALFVARRKGFLASLLQTLFLAPLIFPAIVLGLALLLFFKLIGGMPEFIGLVLAHSILGMPFVIRAVSASLLAVDPVLEEASQSLRAGPLRTFGLITLPLIWPGILSGAMFAFILSFGELNTALFLTGPGVTTLPIEIFSYLQFQGGQLVIAAASAVQVGMIAVMVVILERLVGLSRVVRSN